MSEILERWQQVTDLLGNLARVDRSTVSDEELTALLGVEEAAGRYLDASRIFTAGEVADRSRYELGATGLSMRQSQRKPVDLIEELTRVSKAEASRRVRVGLAIRSRTTLLGDLLAPERPFVAEALKRGELGIDSAQTIVHSLKQAASGSAATSENMDAAETSLVSIARTDPADSVADISRHWRDALDPDGIEPRYEEILQKRGITIGRERNGIKRYTIDAAPPLAAALDATFADSMDPKASPRFLSEEDRARATVLVEEEGGRLVETVVDPRSIEQKRSDILEGVLTAGMRASQSDPVNLRTVGSVTAVIRLTDLENGTGFGILEGTDEVIPASAIQEMVCDTGFFKVLLSENDLPLAHGPLERYFTQAQRRAMVARDGDRCIAKGCRRKASACHAHHVVFFSHDGPTDIDNGVLLCPAHHHALHQGAFEIRMVGGKPWIRAGIDSLDDEAWAPAGRNRVLLNIAA